MWLARLGAMSCSAHHNTKEDNRAEGWGGGEEEEREKGMYISAASDQDFSLSPQPIKPALNEPQLGGMIGY